MISISDYVNLLETWKTTFFLHSSMSSSQKTSPSRCPPPSLLVYIILLVRIVHIHTFYKDYYKLEIVVAIQHTCTFSLTLYTFIITYNIYYNNYLQSFPITYTNAFTYNIYAKGAQESATRKCCLVVYIHSTEPYLQYIQEMSIKYVAEYLCIYLQHMHRRHTCVHYYYVRHMNIYLLVLHTVIMYVYLQSLQQYMYMTYLLPLRSHDTLTSITQQDILMSITCDVSVIYLQYIHTNMV